MSESDGNNTRFRDATPGYKISLSNYTLRPLTDEELSDQHRQNAGTYTEATIDYRASRSIESYVNLRRKYPDQLIQISNSWSHDWIHKNTATLTKLGIDPQIIVTALDADLHAISELSIGLMELVIERQKRKAAGETHLQSRDDVIADAFICHLISMMLDAFDFADDLTVPRDLMVLIKHMLGTDNSAEAKRMENELHKYEAIELMAQSQENGDNLSYREIGRRVGVNVSTITRWFQDEEVQHQIDLARKEIAFLNSDKDT